MSVKLIMNDQFSYWRSFKNILMFALNTNCHALRPFRGQSLGGQYWRQSIRLRLMNAVSVLSIAAVLYSIQNGSLVNIDRNSCSNVYKLFWICFFYAVLLHYCYLSIMQFDTPLWHSGVPLFFSQPRWVVTYFQTISSFLYDLGRFRIHMGSLY